MSKGEMWDRLAEKVDSVKASSETVSRDALILAEITLFLAYTHDALEYPHSARTIKDAILRSTRKLGLSGNLAKEIGDVLTVACESAEKRAAKQAEKLGKGP